MSAPFGFPKPVRGTALLASRERRRGRVTAEQHELHAALDRDGGGKGRRVCRFPACASKALKLPIDPCHVRQPNGVKHRGIGGDPTGTRTQRQWTVSLCRADHGRYDAGEIDVVAQDDAVGMDGTVDWYVKHPETGRLELVASEVRIGVSVNRSEG